MSRIPYGTSSLSPCMHILTIDLSSVRLGNSGLKVSKIILGCMSYGTINWQEWFLREEDSIKQIKAA